MSARTTGGCPEQEPLLSAYLDGELDEAVSEQLDRHLAVCKRCAVEVEHLAEVRGLLRSLPVRRLPATVALRALVEPRDRSPWARNAAAFAAIAAGLLAGTAFGLGAGPEPDTPTVAIPLDVFVADHMAHTVGDAVGLPVLADAQP